MPKITLVKPELSQPDSSEDPKIINAFTALEALLNGGLDSYNLASGAVEATNLSVAVQAILNSFPSGNPVGTIVAFGGTVAPTGFVLCDGTSYLRSEYAPLFSVIGANYGSSDGSHFNVPDLRGRSIVGEGAGAGLTARTHGEKIGEEKHELKPGEMAKHTHTATDSGHEHGFGGGLSVTIATPGAAGGWAPGANGFGTLPSTASVKANVANSEAGNNEAHNNMQPSTVCAFIIKV